MNRGASTARPQYGVGGRVTNWGGAPNAIESRSMVGSDDKKT